jgi:two-component system phosphate regulon response regulator PhoB
MKPAIFVVEDDADISRLVRHHLEQAGYQVRPFATATPVLAAAQKDPPALFLLDIMVPGGDGLDLCRRIRQSSSIGTTPVIFLTAKGEETDRVVGLELGADDYISEGCPAALRRPAAAGQDLLR